MDEQAKNKPEIIAGIGEPEEIILHAGRHTARLILPTDIGATQDYQTLRHEYFVAKRGWVKPNASNCTLETDQYDEESFHLGVFEEEEGVESLQVYIRLTPWWATSGFMLDNEF